jgi:hypothetical protein
MQQGNFVFIKTLINKAGVSEIRSNLGRSILGKFGCPSEQILTIFGPGRITWRPVALRN